MAEAGWAPIKNDTKHGSASLECSMKPYGSNIELGSSVLGLAVAHSGIELMNKWTASWYTIIASMMESERSAENSGRCLASSAVPKAQYWMFGGDVVRLVYAEDWYHLAEPGLAGPARLTGARYPI